MKYQVSIMIQCNYKVTVVARGQDEAERKVRKQITLSLGDLENNDSLFGNEYVGVDAHRLREDKK